MRQPSIAWIGEAAAEGSIMTNDPAPISLAGAPLGDTRHVCALFQSKDEEYRVLLPFIKDGLACGDKAIHIIDFDQRSDHLKRLADAGINTTAAERSGQLELLDGDAHVKDGRFDQELMLGAFEHLSSEKRGDGFRRSRIICRMDWGSKGRRFEDDVVEFESRFNELWRYHNDVVVCTFHLERLTGDVVMNIMRTHPIVVVGGGLYTNPFYVPPERFLPEFRARRDTDVSAGRLDV
jgi:hypothetical protein